MKKKLIILISVLLAVILAAVCVFDLLRYNTGVVTNITATSQGDDTLQLKITYFFGMGGYSVGEVSQDEGEYTGDGMNDYDGAIGKSRILISFGDVAPRKNMFENGIIEIKNGTVPLKAKIAFPSDHGFALYIGSDTPLSVEETETAALNAFGGTIKIPITLG